MARFEGATEASTITVDAQGQFFAGSTLRVTGAGAITLRSQEIDFVGGTGTVRGAGELNLKPYNANTTIDIGSPTPGGTLDLSDIDINALADGFSTITIGRPDATGRVVVGSSLFKDNLVLQTGDLIIEANTLIGQDVRIFGNLNVVSSGEIVTNDDLFANEITLSAVNSATFHGTVNGTSSTITAGTDGTGDILFDAALQFTGAATLTAGATAGNILFSANLASPALTLAATAGEITQTAGRTIASDISAVARDGITLLTRADHIKARVTGAGDLVLRDDNAAPHVLQLGGTAANDILSTAEGNITVEALGNLDLVRVEANGAVNLTGNEMLAKGVVGSPAVFTGTTVLDNDQTTFGQPILFQGDVRMLRDLTFDSNGGSITITGRILAADGTQGLTLIADGGPVLVGGGDAEYLRVENAGSFTLGGALHTTGNFEVEADTIALNAPGRSITTDSGALTLQPRDTIAGIDIGRQEAAFSLDDNELLALGDGWSNVQIGRTGGAHEVRIESARFLDNVAIHGDTIAVLASSTQQGVDGISAVNGAEKNSIILQAQTALSQGRRAGITAGGDVTLVADTMALDPRSANSIRGFGTLTLSTSSAGVPVTLSDATETGGLHLTSRELTAVNSSFAKVR
ncbi:MAG: hypothetical protein EOP83_23760, partial [Verrucomicrobiaceae bacterium]